MVALRPHPDLPRLAKIIGGIRADLWQQFGGSNALRLGPIKCKSLFTELYKHLNVDGTIRNLTAIATLLPTRQWRIGRVSLENVKKVSRLIPQRVIEDLPIAVGQLSASLNAQALSTRAAALPQSIRRPVR